MEQSAEPGPVPKPLHQGTVTPIQDWAHRAEGFSQQTAFGTDMSPLLRAHVGLCPLQVQGGPAETSSRVVGE